MSGSTARAGVEVQYRATGVEAVKRASQDVTRSAGQMQQRMGSASMQVASAMEMIARQGKVTGESLKQVAQQGGQIAFMFGPQGAIAGAVLTLGVAMFSFWQRTRKEMEETRKKGMEEMEALVRGLDLMGASRKKQFAFSGDPDAKVMGRREGETDVEFISRSEGIQGVSRRLALFESMKTGRNREKRIELWKNELAKLRAQYDLAAVAVKHLTDAEARRAANLQHIARLDRKPETGGAGGMDLGASSLAFGAMRMRGSSQRMAMGERARGPAGTGGIAGLDLTPYQQAIIAGAQTLAAFAEVNFGETLGQGIANGFNRAFSGEGISGVIKGFGSTVLSAIGGLFQQMGMAYMQFGKIMSWATALYNPATAGVAGILLGVSLMALGGALQGLASGGGGGGGGGMGRMGGGAATSGIVDRGLINPMNPLNGAGSITPRSATVNNFTVIGTNDPRAQRDIADLINNGRRSGRG